VISNPFLKLAIVLVLLLTFVAPSAGDTEVRPTVAVTYEVEPATFMPGDTGTITIVLENMATGEIYVREDNETFDMNAYIVRATLLGDGDIEILDSGYTNIGLMGPGDTLQLTFNIKASEEASEGVHFLNFELVGGSDMYDLNYKVPVKIDNRDLKVIVSNLPTTLVNEISTITVDVVNMRSNEVSGVIVVPDGNDVTFTPSEVFVGTITAGNKSTATFTLNTLGSEEGTKDISFSASYFNGDNLHQSNDADITINVIRQSPLILTGIEVVHTGNSYTITGDLNNVGTTDAKNVVISVVGSDGIEPVQPYANYFVGTLEADDFSSFELSARITSGDIKSIPVLIEFRNTDNAYSSLTESISLEDSGSAVGGSEGGISSTVLIVIGLASIVIIGIIGYSWKKRKIKPE
jgi:hypothetical protein